MKAMVCELCGSNEFVKQDGMYVCQHCNTKYTPEEAKKLLGTVKIDDSEELKNLYQLARRARDENNIDNAQKYYEMIVIKDPTSWEATFYSVYYKSLNCKIGEIKTAANNVNNVVSSALALIKDNLETAEEKNSAITEVCSKAFYISKLLMDAAENHYKDIDISIRNKYYMECAGRILAAEFIKDNTCNKLVDYFSDDADVFKVSCIPVLKNRVDGGAAKPMFIDAIKKYEPDYEPPKKETPVDTNTNTQSTDKKSGGCYVATAVYGSYDCPQVWTLRRYRDDTLAKTWFGRAFIRTYYAISPSLVKWFGNTDWFRNMWKPKLDRMVSNLNSEGVENTPYEDKQW